MARRHLFSWLRRAHGLCADRRGISLVVVAISLTALMGMLALVLDGGYAYGQKRMLQNAADAGALAGLRTYWIEEHSNEYAARAAAGSTACQYAILNGVPVGSGRGTCVISFENMPGASGPSSFKLKVSVTKTWDTYFAGLLGYDTLTAGAQAKARIQGLKGTSNLWPIVVREDNWVPCHAADPCNSDECQNYTIQDRSGQSALAPGNFSWVDWNADGRYGSDWVCDPYGAGAPRLECSLKDSAASGYWQIGDWVGAETGSTNSREVQDAIRLQRCSHITVPVFDDVTGNGSNVRYHIKGFAEFVLTEFQTTGTPKTISGHFIDWADTGESTYTNCDSTRYECTIHLVNN